MNSRQNTSDEIVMADVVLHRPGPTMPSGGPRTGGAGPISPAGEREWLSVLLLVILADATIYHGHGYAGLALLFVLAPILLLSGAPRPKFDGTSAGLGVMLWLLAGRLLWCGSAWYVAVGFLLVAAYSFSLAGFRPDVLATIAFGCGAVLTGIAGAPAYAQTLRRRGLPVNRVPWLSVILPVASFLLFGLIFLLANPDLFDAFGTRFQRLLTSFQTWLSDWSPGPLEVVFWFVVVWVVMGLLRPVIYPLLHELVVAEWPLPGPVKPSTARAFLYNAFRNMLFTVIALFAVYLVFEFKTLWFRVFPLGFYYAGYAHQGAAWLTVALALSTLILSVVFRGTILTDPRLPGLRRLAWIWSVENLVLALAVYNRMLIYVRFNGMTQMRMVGLFGMTLVVCGFLLVLWKIAHNRSFLWLIRRQLWALALTVYLYALTPVDAIVFQYNVSRIMDGDLAPSVQISVQTINAEAIPLLQPLLNCDDPAIREGVRALLAERHAAAEQRERKRQRHGWTAYQIADQAALRQFRANRQAWQIYADSAARASTLAHFHEYVYQWY